MKHFEILMKKCKMILELLHFQLINWLPVAFFALLSYLKVQCVFKFTKFKFCLYPKLLSSFSMVAFSGYFVQETKCSADNCLDSGAEKINS